MGVKLAFPSKLIREKRWQLGEPHVKGQLQWATDDKGQDYVEVA
jgi:hypothetical protein